MLQLLLMILKILGIIVLVILGIILTVLLVVLLVPVRYRGDVSFDGKPKGEILVSWLLRIVKVRVSYDGDALKALVKILWFRLFEQTLWPSEETEEVVEELVEDEFFAEVPSGEVVEDVGETAAKTMTTPVDSFESSVVTDESVPKPVEETAEAAKTVEVRNKKNVIDSNSEQTKETHQRKTVVQTAANDGDDIVKEEKTPLFDTIVPKVQSAASKLIEKIKTLYNSLTGKYAAGKEKIDTVREFLGKEENQNTIRLLWRQIKKIIKHILPGKLSGRVKFGFDDPATTGQILTYISPFYGMYAKTVSVEPVFDEKVMEGELHLKGRIRLGTLLWNVVRVFFNKNFRTLLKKVLKRTK